MLGSKLMERLRIWRLLIGQVKDDYVRAHGRTPAIFRPRRFTEKMQWRKLFDFDPRLAIISDKLAVRDFVAAQVGPDYLIPLLWSGDDPHALPLEVLTPPYVLKSNHAAGHTWVVHDRSDIDPAAMREAAAGWLLHCHGTAMCEPGYINVRRRLMVEAMLFAPQQAPPIEYKLFVFGGRVRVILSLVVAPDRIARQAAFYDPGWSPLGWRMKNVASQSTLLPRPSRLPEMIEIAERLAEGFSHLRVDLYDTSEGIRVGELTPYTWSGHEPYHPATVDLEMGVAWPIRFAALRALWTMATRRHPVRPRELAWPAL
jgi:hypothetical protein